jgi:hypothetical protein
MVAAAAAQHSTLPRQRQPAASGATLGWGVYGLAVRQPRLGWEVGGGSAAGAASSRCRSGGPRNDAAGVFLIRTRLGKVFPMGLLLRQKNMGG